jgi:hypothetical protein
MAIANGLRSEWPVRNAQSHKANIVIAINDTVAKMTGGLSRIRWKDRLNHIPVVMASKAQNPATTTAKRSLSTRLLAVNDLFIEQYCYSLAGTGLDNRGSPPGKASRGTTLSRKASRPSRWPR